MSSKSWFLVMLLLVGVSAVEARAQAFRSMPHGPTGPIGPIGPVISPTFPDLGSGSLGSGLGNGYQNYDNLRLTDDGTPTYSSSSSSSSSVGSGSPPPPQQPTFILPPPPPQDDQRDSGVSGTAGEAPAESGSWWGRIVIGLIVLGVIGKLFG